MYVPAGQTFVLLPPRANRLCWLNSGAAEGPAQRALTAYPVARVELRRHASGRLNSKRPPRVCGCVRVGAYTHTIPLWLSTRRNRSHNSRLHACFKLEGRKHANTHRNRTTNADTRAHMRTQAHAHAQTESDTNTRLHEHTNAHSTDRYLCSIVL
jgi:hypothetical protein